MSRLCERPGCSEPGAAAYGMVPEDLHFWIAPLARTADPEENVLCQRHADAMVVPRGWTLVDRRDDRPRLFKPRPLSGAPAPRRPSAARPSAKKPTTAHTPVVEQLILDGTADIPRPSANQMPAEVDDHDDKREPIEAPADGEATNGPDNGSGPWNPAFDQHDDLDGLLRVNSPLLARAFRGTDRPRD